MFKKWEKEVNDRLDLNKKNLSLNSAKKVFHKEIVKAKYSYNFYWLGIPILQIPQDLQAYQEIIWKVKPEVIVETGVAYGGSLIFSACMMMLLEASGEIENGRVVGVEINFFKESKELLFSNNISKKITIVDGSSIDEKIIKKVETLVKNKKVLVFLDSNHTQEHVLAELEAYSNFVDIGSYIIVEDTGVENLPNNALFNKPWGKCNSPKSAIDEFLKNNESFIIDRDIESKILITSSPGGFLKRIK